jgi:hypothetical protein
LQGWKTKQATIVKQTLHSTPEPISPVCSILKWGRFLRISSLSSASYNLRLNFFLLAKKIPAKRRKADPIKKQNLAPYKFQFIIWLKIALHSYSPPPTTASVSLSKNWSFAIS